MTIETVYLTLILGIGATLFMDIWALLMKRLFQIQGLDYRLVGRWFIYLFKGQVSHKTILQTTPVKAELPLGWLIHYAIGIQFAALLIWFWGLDWLISPTLLPALIVGIVTTAAPFFILQPAFGFGVAAAKTPAANMVRLKSLMAHTSYGMGLYITALIISCFH